MVLTYFLAFLAACANATASVLQRKASRNEPSERNLSWRLIRDLMHRPLWFGGVLAVIAGFLLQATALGYGQLAVVEPILVLELPATLVLSSLILHSRLHGREWGSAAVMTAGLVGLLYFLSPSAGRATGLPWDVWLVGVIANLAIIAAAVGWARRLGDSARKAATLGVATGCGFGLTAALMKGMTNAFAHGMVALFTSWELYAMIAAGGMSMFLLQSAMSAGRLIATQPGLTLSDPVVSILWGVLAFNEAVRGGLFLILAVLSGLMMSAAVVVLARSPLLQGASGQMEEDQQKPESSDRTTRQ